jgi:hypothetical protein
MQYNVECTFSHTPHMFRSKKKKYVALDEEKDDMDNVETLLCDVVLTEGIGQLDKNTCSHSKDVRSICTQTESARSHSVGEDVVRRKAGVAKKAIEPSINIRLSEKKHPELVDWIMASSQEDVICALRLGGHLIDLMDILAVKLKGAKGADALRTKDKKGLATVDVALLQRVLKLAQK